MNVDNETANIIKNNETVNAAYVACVIALANYTHQSSSEYPFLRDEYFKRLKVFQDAVKAAKA